LQAWTKRLDSLGEDSNVHVLLGLGIALSLLLR
jgi:hypothetical protein